MSFLIMLHFTRRRNLVEDETRHRRDEVIARRVHELDARSGQFDYSTSTGARHERRRLVVREVVRGLTIRRLRGRGAPD